ncbi:hypothetical protein BKX96_04440 [Pseudomonas putida]|nr:hypothetical protein BKX96_04440 [Pseudomonas putida]
MAYRMLGRCAVTPSAQMSAACQGEGRSLQAYCATQVKRSMLHRCKPSVLEMEKLFRLGAICFRSRRMQGAALRGAESSASESDRSAKEYQVLGQLTSG